MAFVHTKLLELLVLQPGHDPVERVDLLPLTGSHEPSVLSPDVEGEDGLLGLVGDLALGGHDAAVGTQEAAEGLGGATAAAATAGLDGVALPAPPKQFLLLAACVS